MTQGPWNLQLPWRAPLTGAGCFGLISGYKSKSFKGLTTRNDHARIVELSHYIPWSAPGFMTVTVIR